MRSKIRRRVLFIVFSALVMVGLIIGVFADYNDDRVGTIVGSTPYDLGDKVADVTTSGITLNSGYYIIKFSYDNYADYAFNIMTLNDNINRYYYTFSSNLFTLYYTYSDYIFYNCNVGDVFYLYVYYEDSTNLKLASANSQEHFVSVEVYNISDTYSIDIYDNSQDVWASVVSVVTDATDSIIANDILLLFAAAVPVISVGVGFLIRLKYKG